MPLQVDLQVDRIRWKVLQMSFQLGDLLLQLALQLRVRAHAFGDQIPFQCHNSLPFSFTFYASRFTCSAYFRLVLSTER